MLRPLIPLILVVALLESVPGARAETAAAPSLNVIFDTDMSSDLYLIPKVSNAAMSVILDELMVLPPR